jgi:hypothetical protein
VNYDAKNTPSISSIDLVCRLPEGTTPKSVRLLRLEEDSPVDLALAAQPHRVSFTVPEMKTYALLVISW